AQLPSIFVQTVNDLPGDLALEQLGASINYLAASGRVTPAQIGEAFAQASSVGGRMQHFLEIIDPVRWQQARQEGRQEGWQEGRQEAVADLTLRQLRRQVGK